MELFRNYKSNRDFLMESCTNQVQIQKIKVLNESEVNGIRKEQVSKLYKAIVEKGDKIDYGKIPDSKGRITKYENYNHIKDLISTLDELLSDAGITVEDFGELNKIKTALNNLEKLETDFGKVYADGKNFIAMIYDNVVYSIVMCLSIIISVAVSFIKDPTTKEIKTTIDDVKRLEKNWDMFNVLRRFNQLTDDGKTAKLIDRSRKDKQAFEAVNESVSVVAETLLLLGLFVVLIREAVFRFYYIRQKLSIQLEKQADFIKMNEYKIRTNTTMKEEEKNKIIDKQNKIAKRLIKWSNRLGVKISKSKNDAEKELMETEPENLFA